MKVLAAPEREFFLFIRPSDSLFAVIIRKSDTSIVVNVMLVFNEKKNSGHLRVSFEVTTKRGLNYYFH